MTYISKNEATDFSRRRRAEGATYREIANELRSRGQPEPGLLGIRATENEFNEGWVHRTLTRKDLAATKIGIDSLSKTVQLPHNAPDLTMIEGRKKMVLERAKTYARRRRGEGASLTLICAEITACGYRSLKDGQCITPDGLTNWLQGVKLPGDRVRVQRALVAVSVDGKITQAKTEARGVEPVNMDVINILRTILNSEEMPPLKRLALAKQVVEQAG